MNPPRDQRKMGLVPTVVFFCFLLSGLSSLIYEVVWMRMLILIFGSTTFAVSTVLTAFMGGLALGSYLSGRTIDIDTSEENFQELCRYSRGAAPYLRD